MYRKLVSVNIKIFEDGILWIVTIDKVKNMICSNEGVSKQVSPETLNRWLSKFFKLVGKESGGINNIADKENIATIEVNEVRRSYSLILGGKKLDALNKLMDRII